VPDKQIPYKTIGDVQLMLDVFLPERGPLSAAMPGIVFFHGGGWSGGSPSQFHPHCQYFASRGMVAMSAEYRLTDRHGTTPYECVADGKSAIRWIRAHAADLGIDPENLAAGGGSAGGHVAAAAAMVTGFEDESDDNSISPTPSALVLFNPVFDNGPGGFGHDQVKDHWQDFSPLHNIADSAPPSIVFLGSEDPLIPVSTAEEFKKRMSDVGARCDVWIYAEQPHGFFNYCDGNNPYYDATLYEADRFMASLGYLGGQPGLQNKAVEATRL
jgi:acetyl esterase